MLEAALAFLIVLVFAFLAHRGLGWVERELERQGPVSKARAWEDLYRHDEDAA